MRDLPGAADLRRFRIICELTAAVTFLLIVVGGVVRVSDSGLGCGPAGSGTHGWPLCGGQVIPLIGDVNRIVEFTHRALAGIVVVLIGLFALRAHRRLRELSWPLRGSLLAGALVILQAGLGGLTVEHNLEDELVAAHLCLAMLLLGLLLWLAVRARAEERALPAEQPAEPERMREPGRGLPSLRPFAAAAAVLLLCAIVAGGYVAGTEEEGAENAAANGAHLACGEGIDAFPGCLDGRVLPFGESRLTDIHLTHRAFVYAATLAIVLLIGAAVRRGARSRLLWLAALLLAAQLLLGALNVWLGEHPSLIVAHLTVATLLWSAVLLIAYTLAFAPEPAAARARAPRAEASTAPA
jgi:heme A synthase